MLTESRAWINIHTEVRARILKEASARTFLLRVRAFTEARSRIFLRKVQAFTKAHPQKFPRERRPYKKERARMMSEGGIDPNRK